MNIILALVLVVGPLAFGVPLTPEDFDKGHTTVIDLNNPEGARILEEHNVNITGLQQQLGLLREKSNQTQQAALRNNFFYPTVKVEPSPMSNHSYSSPMSDAALQSRRQMALEAIRDKVSMVINNDSTDITAHQSTQPVHDIAVYSLCPTTAPVLDIFRANNNSFNLYFDPPTPAMNDNRMYMSSAVLRLFKVDRNASGSSSGDVSGNSSGTECRWNSAHADELIRVTVSAYTMKKKKYRKKTFNSIMIQKAYSGWVELNVRFMISHWLRRNLGLAIDVHDQDENQLAASQFFHPSPNCEASDKPFPFSQFQSTYADSCHKKVPRYPRIDYQYRFCDKSRLKESVYNKRCHHLAALEKSKPHHRHQHYHNHHNHNNHADHHHRPRAAFRTFSFEMTPPKVAAETHNEDNIRARSSREQQEEEEDVVGSVTA